MISSSVSHVRYMYVQMNRYIQAFHAEVFPIPALAILTEDPSLFSNFWNSN